MTTFRKLPFAILLAAAAISALPLGAAAGTGARSASDAAGPVGWLLPVGGHHLYMSCSGAGSPTVVLEAGLGGNHLDWQPVQQALSRHLRVCSYDRAGSGWSEAGPQPRRISTIAEELQELLAEAQVGPGFLLVGHSFGGLAALYYASRFPEEVAGLVLVDTMHPDQYERFAAAGIELSTDPEVLAKGRTPEQITEGMGSQTRPLALELATSAKAEATLADELRQVPASIAELRAYGLPRVPTAVLVHGRRDWDRLYDDGRMENLWLAMQAELATQLAAEGLVVAWGSGHQVPLEDPELVAKVVLNLSRKIQR